VCGGSLELQRIYDSEITVRISWLWDGSVEVRLGDEVNGVEVRLGDEVNGFEAEERVASVSENKRLGQAGMRSLT